MFYAFRFGFYSNVFAVGGNIACLWCRLFILYAIACYRGFAFREFFFYYVEGGSATGYFFFYEYERCGRSIYW